METLSVTINSPEKIVWEGIADVVTSENSQGIFNILPEHANFVTVIEKKPIYIQHKKEKDEFFFDTAVLSVNANVVTIYVDL